MISGELRVIAIIPATDLERARRFYAEKFGIAPAVEDRDEGLLFIFGDGSRFLLYETQFAGTAEHTVASFVVDDLDAAMSSLRGRGVVFEEYDYPGFKTVNGVVAMGQNRAAWFKDSEGNIIALSELSDAFPR